MNFTEAETLACRDLVALALAEDVGPGDITSQAIIPESLVGQAAFVARIEGVVSGLPAAREVFTAVEPRLDFQPFVEDGRTVRAGERLAVVSGPMRGILTGERTALNFLQRMSGVATLTRLFVEAIAGLKCKILDTRKTTPGWRLLEKYAVRCGGGCNLRMGLYDGILIKDNHLAALQDAPNAMQATVEAARKHSGERVPLEIEVDDLEQFDVALRLHPDIILLDNMKIAQLREAVARRDARMDTCPVLLEASGGVALATVRALAETGVDRISVGAMTHSAPALDIGLDYGC